MGWQIPIWIRRGLSLVALGAMVCHASANSKPVLPKLQISAASAVIMDADSGRVLWSKDPNTPRYPASTTKIMTTLLLLEMTQPADLIAAPIDVEKVGEASMHLRPAELVSARDLAFAMMLRSANDACYAAAVHLAGSVDEFAKLMNERAAQIGCKNTNFLNPHGLNNRDHKVSAYDLALIGREAMKRHDFREIVRTQKVQITRSENQGDLWMLNKNKWLKKDATADGIKTGWTIPAGKCYVGSATRNGFRVITAILKSDDWQTDHQKMLNWAFANFKTSGDMSFFKVPAIFKDGVFTSPGAEVRGRVAMAYPKGSKFTYSFIPKAPFDSVVAGEEYAEMRLEDETGYRYTVPMYAIESVAAPKPKKGIAATFSTTSGVVMGLLLCGGVLYLRRRSRRFHF